MLGAVFVTVWFYVGGSALAEERQFGGKVDKIIPCICNGQHNGSNADVYIEVGDPHGNDSGGTGKYMITTSTRRYDYDPVQQGECALGMKKENAEDKECWVRVYKICVMVGKGKEIGFYGSSSTTDCDISGKPGKNTSTSGQTPSGYSNSSTGNSSSSNSSNSNSPASSNNSNNTSTKFNSSSSLNINNSNAKSKTTPDNPSIKKSGRASGEDLPSTNNKKQDHKDDSVKHNKLELNKQTNSGMSAPESPNDYSKNTKINNKNNNRPEKDGSILEGIENFDFVNNSRDDNRGIKSSGILANLKDFTLGSSNFSAYNKKNTKNSSLSKQENKKTKIKEIDKATFIQKAINIIVKLRKLF